MRLRGATCALLAGMACAPGPTWTATATPTRTTTASTTTTTAETPSARAAAPAAPLAAEAQGGASSRLYAVRDKAWIWPRPNADGRFLGYVRAGQGVALRAAALVSGINCRGGFYAIEPRGFVCNDDAVTRDAAHPFLRDNAATLPAGGALPYRYAISNGAPMYARVPTAREQKHHEWPYGKPGEHAPLPLFQRGHEQLALDAPIPASDATPEFLAAGRSATGYAAPDVFVRTIPGGSLLSFTRAFESGGRTWLLSADLTVVPADRVRPFRASSFAGVVLAPRGASLPIAWFRATARPQYRRDESGGFAATGASWPARSWTALTGVSSEQGGRRWLETAEGAPASAGGKLWADADDATVVERRRERPFLVKPGEKWILVSIMKGTLVAYDDLEPVFTTLISPGIGGVPRPGGDLIADGTTPLGNYRITFKDRAATMSPQSSGDTTGDERRFWIADVPATQYFAAPFALHAAYWHESFGEPMSAGCVNASPSDAAWLFDWSDPRVPDGWQGASGAGNPENGGSTWVVVTR